MTVQLVGDAAVAVLELPSTVAVLPGAWGSWGSPVPPRAWAVLKLPSTVAVLPGFRGSRGSPGPPMAWAVLPLPVMVAVLLLPSAATAKLRLCRRRWRCCCYRGWCWPRCPRR